MNVLCAGHYYHVKGGSDRYMVEMAELLEVNGNTVLPFAVQDENNLESRFSEYFPVATNTVSPALRDIIRYNYSVSANRSLRELLRKNPVEIAHLHIYYGQLTTSILNPLRKLGIPIVQTLHEYKLTCPVYTHLSNGVICDKCQGKRFSNVVRNKCKSNSTVASIAVAVEASLSRVLGDVEKIDHFIAPSDFMKTQMVSQGVIPERKITKLNYHIDTNKYQARGEVGEYILYFGRLAEVKGIVTLVDAVAGTNVKLVIAGEGPLRKMIESRVLDEGLKNVEIVGFKKGNELFELVHGSICTVLPSEWYDNLPLAILESMACGKPVIGAKIGGIPEMITDGEDGVLFDSGDVEGLRLAIKSLWDKPEMARSMGVRARIKMKEQFNPQDHYGDLISLYSTLL